MVALARHKRPALTPPRGALNIVSERGQLEDMAVIMANRARAHRDLNPADESRINAYLQGRCKDLLHSWATIGKQQQAVGARLVYQRYEQTDGKALLRMPLESPDPDLGAAGKKFKAPRSLRDVESSVNLFVKRLDGVDMEPPAEATEP